MLPEFSDVLKAIEQACYKASKNSDFHFPVQHIYTVNRNANFRQRLAHAFKECEIVIVDITNFNPDTIFELGYAVAKRKFIILIAQADIELPESDLFRSINFIRYDRNLLSDALAGEVIKVLTSHIKKFENEQTISIEDEEYSLEGIGFMKMNSLNQQPTAFLSYSHKDQETLERLSIHLRPLERLGLIDPWSDKRIRAGDLWRKEIERALSNAAIAVLLISADFLASDFVVKNELPPLLSNAKQKGTRILPVILTPCRFSRDDSLSQYQAVNDPKKPLLLMEHIEQEVVWDKVAQEIEREIGYSGPSTA